MILLSVLGRESADRALGRRAFSAKSSLLRSVRSNLHGSGYATTARMRSANIVGPSLSPNRSHDALPERDGRKARDAVNARATDKRVTQSRPCARAGRSRFRRACPMDATPERDAAYHRSAFLCAPIRSHPHERGPCSAFRCAPQPEGMGRFSRPALLLAARLGRPNLLARA